MPLHMGSPALAAEALRASVLPGLLLAVAGSVAFSGKAIIVKLAYRHGVDAVTLIMLRMLFALPLFVLLAWWAGRGKPALTRRDALAVVGLGFCGYYLASFLDFAGLAYVTASFERLVLVMAHFASAYWDERVELALRYPNLHFDVSGGFQAPELEVRDGPRALTEEDAPRILRKVGIERFMWGTDGPAVMHQP